MEKNASPDRRPGAPGRDCDTASGRQAGTAPVEFDWNSFWDVATPAAMSRALLEECGSRQAASRAAAENASVARWDDREDDHGFWLAVLCRLYGIDVDRHFAP